MGEFEGRVEEIVRDRFGSVAELARITNVKEQTLHSLFSRGSFARSRTETVTSIADALEVDPFWLMRGKLVDRSTRFRGVVEAPLFERIAAGRSVDAASTDERFPIHKELADRHPGAFLLRVAGTAMDCVLPDGCYALVEPCCEVEHPGQPYAVCVDGADATVRRARPLGNGIELSPDSTDTTWRPVVYDFAESDPDDIRILGRVVFYYLPLNWVFA